MVSFLCCYTDRGILESTLLASLGAAGLIDSGRIEVLAELNHPHEPIPVVLNRLAATARGDVLCFVHQDAYLLSGDWPRVAEEHLLGSDLAGVAGVIGRGDDDSSLVGMILQRDGSFLGSAVDGPTDVHSLDEICFATRRDTWEAQKLDPQFELHYYGVDYCYAAAAKGLSCCVIPGLWQHRSRSLQGDLSSDPFLACRDLIVRKWQRTIFATTGVVTYSPDNE